MNNNSSTPKEKRGITLNIPSEVYVYIAAYAAQHGLTPQQVVQKFSDQFAKKILPEGGYTPAK